MAGSEKNFENRVKKYLQSKGIYAVGTSQTKMTKSPVGYYEKRFGNAYVTAGLPDLHVSVLGADIEVELKAPNGKPSELQLRMIEQMNDTCAKAVILYEEVPARYKDDYHYIDFDKFKNLIDEAIEGMI